MLPLLRGEADTHKDYVFGIMTTRGINSGSDMFGIRTVRDSRYRLVWDLNHEMTFQNACTTSKGFQSMVQAAGAGDEHAQEVVARYSHRPEFELFDCAVDPLEQNNLFGQPGYNDVAERLQGELEEWMLSQGDQGIETERTSLLRQGRWRNMTLEEAEKAWQSRGQKKK